jgi:hypothetical protein
MCSLYIGMKEFYVLCFGKEGTVFHMILVFEPKIIRVYLAYLLLFVCFVLFCKYWDLYSEICTC